MWTDSPAGLLLPNMPSSGLNDVVRARVDPVSGVPINTLAGSLILSQSAGLLNYNPSKYLKSRAKLSAVIAGTGQMWVTQIGDSTTLGKYADGVNAYTGNYNKSPAWHLATRLQSMGFNADSDSVFYHAGDSAFVFDTRIAGLAGWGQNEGVKSLSGGLFRNNTTGGTLTFTPTNQSSAFDVFWKPFSGYGAANFNAQLGAGASVPCSAAGDDTWRKSSGTATLGGNNLVLTRVSGDCNVAGMRTYNSALGRVHVQNLGWDGGKIQDVRGSGIYAVTPEYALLGSDLTFIRMGINDIGSTTLANFNTYYQEAITAALAVGDVILETFTPQSVTYQNPGAINYYKAIIELAVTNGLAVIDHWQLWNYAATPANTYGLYHSDNVHLLSAGYATVATAEAAAIGRLFA